MPTEILIGIITGVGSQAAGASPQNTDSDLGAILLLSWLASNLFSLLFQR
ncbi:MAG: hypothetical protein ABSB84_14045 [Verrucomicrobiota bacterium]